MKIRDIALNTFSEKRIPLGLPMATLEEVLVPAYLFHRYQIDAAAKVVGGQYYNHTLRGGVQELPNIVPANEQRRALKVLLETINPENLAIDEKILKLIPPRPPGYNQTPELFPGYTGPTFDPYGAAENVAHMTVAALFHPQRAARLVDFHSRNNKNPGLAEVIDEVLSATWKTKHNSSFYAEIQRTVDHVVLHHLIRLAANQNHSPQVKAITSFKLNELKDWLDNERKITKENNQKAHYYFACKTIEQFQFNPDNFMLTEPLPIPPGAPIGN
jgi:hypothetical protein